MSGKDVMETLAEVGPSFVIYAGARTGSTMLASMLNNHLDLACLGELFVRHPDVFESELASFHADFRARFADYEIRQKRWRAYLVAVGRRQSQRWGFKLMNNQYKRLRKYLIEESQCRAIVLRRDNVLAVYASAETARLTGQSHVRVSEQVHRTLVTFDRDAFLRHLEAHTSGYERLTQELDAGGRPYFEVSYAELIGQNASGVHGRLLEFLGASPQKLLPDTLRRGSSDTLARFTNPDAARACLQELNRPDWVSD